jgi:hypothetical protein
MDIPPIIWISEGLLTEGLVLLGGKPKAGQGFVATKKMIL